MKAKKQDQIGVAPLRVGGSLYVDAPSKTKIFSEQFSSVFTANTPETADILAEGPSYPPSRISSLGLRVLKTFARTQRKQSFSSDEIPARLLKELAKELAPAVTALFEQLIEIGDMPEEWSKVWITPVFKKCNRIYPENY